MSAGRQRQWDLVLALVTPTLESHWLDLLAVGLGLGPVPWLLESLPFCHSQASGPDIFWFSGLKVTGR